MKKTFKSIGAVIAGFLTVVIFSVLMDAVLEGIGFFPPATKPEAYETWMYLIALAYRTVFTVLGGFVTAKFAPDKPMKHVVVLAVIGTFIGIGGVVSGWNIPWYPHWYAIALAVLAFPSVYYGGRLALNKKNTS